MTEFYLIRHGENDLLPHTLAGRAPGVHLNSKGRAQAGRLAECLARHPIRQIFASPLERARETAEPLARKLGLEIQISDAFNEVDFGEWTAKPIETLEPQPAWKHWNAFRSAARIPGGETMLEIQARVVAEIEKLRRQFPGQAIAVFAHGDPIRAAVVYYLGIPLDLMLRLAIATASITILRVDDWSAQLGCFNQKCDF